MAMQPVGGQPVGGQPVEGQPVEGQPVEGQPVEGQPVEGPSERNPAERRTDEISRALACEVGDRRVLPLAGEPRPERADAAKNRAILLEAAAEIVASEGVDALSMEAVAARAGVGIGTVYRRFTDLAGLAYALVDEGERRFQRALLYGPPPLGPGAPPTERLRAFVHAYLDRLTSEAELIAVAERGDRRYDAGAYYLQHAHLAGLIADIDPGLDGHVIADAILALLSASLFVHQTRDRHLSAERIKAGLDQLLAGIL